MLKKITTTLLLLCAVVVPCFAQPQTAEVKVNVAAGALTIFNPSLEIGFAKQSALTFDFVASFAEENFLHTGHSMLVSMGLFSYRHYLQKERHSGFFLSGDFGLTLYRMEKNAVPLIANDHGDGTYDVGHGYVAGLTAGYKHYLGERFSLEASLSGGYQHSRHELYSKDGVRRYEFNATGEWTAYKAALNLGYRLWK